MSSINEEISELLALTKLFLFQEYPQTKLKTNSQSPVQAAPPIRQSMPLPAPIPAKEIKPMPMPPKEIAPPPPLPAQPKVEAPKTLPKEKQQFALEPLKMAPEHDLNDIRGLMAERFTTVKIIDAVPSDEEARKMGQIQPQSLGETAFIILSFDEPVKHRNFLENITRALQICVGPTQLLSAQKCEYENRWEALLQSPNLRLVIASDRQIRALQGLMKHYRETAKDARCYLGKVPLYLLPDLSVYFQQPRLKEALWKAINER